MSVTAFENPEFKASSSHEFGVKTPLIQRAGKVTHRSPRLLKNENMNFIYIYTHTQENHLLIF